MLQRTRGEKRARCVEPGKQKRRRISGYARYFMHGTSHE
jgi:hypothetical protein